MSENITRADIDAYKRGSKEVTDTGQQLSQQVQRFLGEVNDPSVLGTRDTIGKYGNPMYRVAIGWVGRCLNELAGAYDDHGQALNRSATGYEQNEQLNGSQATQRGHLNQREVAGGNAVNTGWTSPELNGGSGVPGRPDLENWPKREATPTNQLPDWPGGRRPGADWPDGVDPSDVGRDRTSLDPNGLDASRDASRLAGDDASGIGPDGVGSGGRGSHLDPGLVGAGDGTSAAGLAPGDLSSPGLDAGDRGGHGGHGVGGTGGGAGGRSAMLNPNLGGASPFGGRPGGGVMGAEGGPGMMPPPAAGGKREDRRGQSGNGPHDQHLATDDDDETVWDSLSAERLQSSHHANEPTRGTNR
ncbi:hypothetical protein HJ590_03330 [Naumannella sp. ID2617S]|nr:hypothetical protein [Naumannella sp. ID2617S]